MFLFFQQIQSIRVIFLTLHTLLASLNMKSLPLDIEILGWCPVELVLPHWMNVSQ